MPHPRAPITLQPTSTEFNSCFDCISCISFVSRLARDRQSSTRQFSPSKPNSSKYYTLPYRPNLPFLISDIRAQRQSARMSEIKNSRLGLYGAEHSKCNRVMTLGFRVRVILLAFQLFKFTAHGNESGLLQSCMKIIGQLFTRQL